MVLHRAGRDVLESSLFEAQQLAEQLQTQQEHLEGEAQSSRQARQALQGAPAAPACLSSPHSPKMLLPLPGPPGRVPI